MFKFKKLCAFLFIFNTCSAINSNDAAIATSILRIPALILKNNIRRESKYRHLAIISVDVLRLANEVLEIINKDTEIEVKKYDCCWMMHDVASLIMHIKDIAYAPEDELQNSDEVNIPKGSLKTAHTKILPLIEGVTALLAATSGNTIKIEDAFFRLQCKSFNSMARLLDNIVTSKYKSRTQILYGIVLLVTIVITIQDIYTMHSQIKTEEDNRRREQEERERQRRQKQAEQEQQVREAQALEEARRNEEYAQIRRKRDAEEAQQRLEEASMRNIALQKTAGNPLRVAWERVAHLEQETHSLQNQVTTAENDLSRENQTRMHNRRDNLFDHDTDIDLWHSSFDPFAAYYENSVWGKMEKERVEKERITKIVQRELQREHEKNEQQKDEAEFEKKAQTIRLRLQQAQNLFYQSQSSLQNAKNLALQLSRRDQAQTKKPSLESV